MGHYDEAYEEIYSVSVRDAKEHQKRQRGYTKDVEEEVRNLREEVRKLKEAVNK